MARRARLKDVAQEAGVSTATVSYVINKLPSQTLSPETVERVNEAIEKLGYVPNMAARALVNNRSKMIGVVIPQTEPGKEFMFSNPFYGEFLSHVEYIARTHGYHVLISGTHADQTYLEIANTRGLDGIIIVGMYTEEYYTDLKKTQIPVVLVDSYADDHYFHSVQIDDRLGGYLATKHLIERGHKTIAHVTGLIKDQGVNAQRLMGYRDALLEADIPFDAHLLHDGTVSFEHGQAVGARMNGCSAVFTSADILSIGLISGLKARGLRVPDDISVVSFDDTWLSSLCDPALTAVRQDIALKGKMAAEMIIQLSEGVVIKQQEVILPIHVVERSSVVRLND